jgi:hypothetical protein
MMRIERSWGCQGERPKLLLLEFGRRRSVFKIGLPSLDSGLEWEIRVVWSLPPRPAAPFLGVGGRNSSNLDREAALTIPISRE